MTPRYSLVLFDLDGTLMETAPALCNAVNRTLEQLSLPQVTIDEVTPAIGHGTLALLDTVLARVSPSNAVKNDFRHRFQTAFERHYLRECIGGSALYPGAASTLATLRGCGVKLALVTNKESRYVTPLLVAHGFETLFDVVVTGDTLPVKKPHPGVIDHCLGRLGISARGALLVGDSCTDVETARNAGIDVWLFPWGYQGGRPIVNCPPDRVLSSYQELVELLLPATAAAPC